MPTYLTKQNGYRSKEQSVLQFGERERGLNEVVNRYLSVSNKHIQMAESNDSGLEPTPKPQVMYRCKKCRRIVAAEENIVPHERGKGEQCFKYKKRSGGIESAECSSIFVEPMKWMESVQEGFVGEKLQCMGCKARLGSFNWAGMQCNCGAWINPAFQLHKSRIDECRM
ncbi:hypothetical protein CFOL_v3_33287 [Cephalotus follicularis]|uniref:Uncharacterized protein n=1 Tax=Cephalotus follicularis TaxID=3775 RepID=A0A1Q3DBS4_CEPFO|nr:hypothetical protein CFOL_v3_33287 [Cephalotus follicularis]